MRLIGINDKRNISYKKILPLLCLGIIVLSIIVFYKSYAIYQLENDYEVINSKIGNYTMGDIRIMTVVDGKETESFPTYESNYLMTNIECTNGLNATWDAVNWRLAIENISSDNSKCTIYFDSTKKNSEKPINYSQSALLNNVEDSKNTTIKNIKQSVIEKIYPIGSIYLSTTDDTIDSVANKFGGTWIKYSEGASLISSDSNYSINSTGGSDIVTLASNNIPSLKLTGTTNSTGSGYSIGYTYANRTVSSWSGAHTHNISREFGTTTNLATSPESETYSQLSGSSAATRVWSSSPISATTITVSGQTVTEYFANSISGVASHFHTFTGNYTNNSTKSINIKNPYTSVYMYKRIK